MSKIDDYIDRKINLTLGEYIELYRRGDDDKIYLDLYLNGNEYEPLFEDIRIIDSKLDPYLDYRIEYLHDVQRGIGVGIVENK